MTDEDRTARGISRSVFKSTVMLTIADLLTRLTTLVVTLMISRRLGVASLGIYGTATATYALIAVAGGLGATNYMVREIARRPEDTGRFFAHVAAIGVAFAAAVIGGFFLIMPHLGYSRELALGMSIIIVALVAGTLNTLNRAVFVAHQRVVFITYTVAVAAVVNILISWWMLAAGQSVAWLLLAFVVGQYVVMVFGLLVIHTGIARLEWRLDWAYSKKIMREIRTFAALSLLAALFAQPEILIMSTLRDEVDAGYFTAAFRVISFWMIVPSVFMTNVFPYMAKESGTRDRALRLQHTSVRYLLLATIPLAAGTAILARPIIRLLYGEGYEQAVAPLQIMSALLVFNALDQVFWRVLAARDEQHNDLRVRVIGASYRIAVGAALISVFGVEGGAWSALSSVVLAAGMLGFYVKRNGTPLRIIGLGGRSLVAAIFMAGVLWVLADHLPVLALVVVGAAVYAGLVWALRVFTDEDKRLIKSIIWSRRGEVGM